jgi:hypothetical protein
MLLIAAPASAGTLDAEQPLYGDLAHGLYADDEGSGEQSVAQTFTALSTGNLDQVDLYLEKFGSPVDDLMVEIWDTVGGTPVNTLATESVPSSALNSVFSFVPVTIDPPVPVTAGTQYAIVAWTAAPHGPQYYWGEENENPYAGGELRVQLGPTSSPPVVGGWGPAGATVDMTFKTYVDVPATVPPPGPLPTPPVTGPTGKRAAALKKCKKKKSKKARKKCKKRAKKLPV